MMARLAYVGGKVCGIGEILRSIRLRRYLYFECIKLVLFATSYNNKLCRYIEGMRWRMGERNKNACNANNKWLTSKILVIAINKHCFPLFSLRFLGLLAIYPQLFYAKNTCGWTIEPILEGILEMLCSNTKIQKNLINGTAFNKKKYHKKNISEDAANRI